MPENKSENSARKSCTACKRDYFSNLKVCPHCGDQNRDPFVGRTISDRYLVESIIGEGGMGIVYRASQKETKRDVAVKILKHQFMSDELAVKRFKHEAVAASRLSHPHIVALHDYGSTVDDFLFMVMEIIDGKSLAKLVHERRSLPPVRTVNVITQVCDALAHAHERGVLHRDLKPGNILLTEFGDEKDYVKLVDFGIAKLLTKDGDEGVDTQIEQEGEVLGSPLYMSPEQCLGRTLDARSDIYGLGIVLYETLTGKVPHVGRTAHETIEMQLQKVPMPFAAKRTDIELPASLETVVFKALSKSPADRQQSMQELAAELKAAVVNLDDSVITRSSVPAVRGGSLKSSDAHKKHQGSAGGTRLGIVIGLLVCIAVIAAMFVFKVFKF